MPRPSDAKNEPEDPEVKDLTENLRDAEKRFRRLIERRNEINDQAREIRAERDTLNDQKKNHVAEMRKLQDERDRLNAESRVHRDKRNEYQRAAKALIESKRKLRGPAREGSEGGSVGHTYRGKVRQLEHEIAEAHRRQETSVMPVAKENELIKEIQAKAKELEQARVMFSEESKLLSDVKDVDGKINELFAMADAEHKIVVELSTAAQAAHDAIIPILDQLRFLDTESDKKHQEYIKLRTEADEHHQKANELRGEVDELYNKRQGVFKERKAIIVDQKKAVREALFDEAKLSEKADEELKALMTKGKISL